MEPYNPNKPFISMKLDGSLLDRMVDEYGPVDGTYYYKKLFDSDYNKYPHPQDIGVDYNLLKRMYETYYK